MTADRDTAAVPAVAVPLTDAADAARYGGKAAQLAAAVRAGLPVPEGVALDAATVERIADGELDGPVLAGGPFAVRSSAIDEDAADASFAGQHRTCLGVPDAAAVAGAVREVWESGRTPSAMAYRDRMGLPATVSVAVVVQQLVAADVAGVLFTRNPVTGADERVVEAAWGLGEAVVQGLVTPDLYRLDTAGAVVERNPGYKDVAVRLDVDGGTAETPTAEHLVEALCLDDGQLVALHRLAERCARAFHGPRDIEWAFAGGRLWLLQCRPVTTL